MISELTQHLAAGRNLTSEQVTRAVRFLVSDYPDEAKAEFLTALATKGETPEEVASFATAFLEKSLPLDFDAASLGRPVLDVCGTGGDKLGLFNISTTAALVLAAGGVCVAKHGNRGVSSRSGGADVLETLGVKIDLDPAAVRHGLDELNFAFIFAQRYHPAFKALASVRRQLGAAGTVTIFNLLGPLLNPVRPSHQLVGIFRSDLLDAYARTLAHLGRQRAWVVNGSCGEHGMDEISILGPTRVAVLDRGQVHSMEIDPSQFVSAPVRLEILRGGDAVQNAEIVTGILDGSITDHRRDIVVANAAAGFVVVDVASDLAEGMDQAREHIDSGAASALLSRLIAAS